MTTSVDRGSAPKGRELSWFRALMRPFDAIGGVGLFAFKVVQEVVRPPFEMQQCMTQLAEIGAKSLSLVLASGVSIGAIMTFHTRSNLVQFGATALIPAVQALAFFVEIGPLVAALLVAGRVGSGIGAVLSNMRATEQIDAIEALSLNSFNFLVVPRVVACVIALPILTLFMDAAGLIGGLIAEYSTSHLSGALYVKRAFGKLDWENFVPPTLKTAVFGFLIGTISAYFGYTTNEGAAGVGRAATNSVVYSSLSIIVADVVLVKLIYFFFPETAL